MTNYEKITKNMTERKKAEYLVQLGMNCEECPALKMCQKNKDGLKDCKKIISEFLFTEVKTKKVPRIQTIHTVEELLEAGKNLEDHCRKIDVCSRCVYSSRNASDYYGACFAAYLIEETEVEEVEDEICIDEHSTEMVRTYCEW